METIQKLAKMIDHSLLHPTMTDHEMKEGCLIARHYDVASVCIKPYSVKALINGWRVRRLRLVRSSDFRTAIVRFG